MDFIKYISERESLVCKLEAKDWREAILLGGRTLVDQGSATPEYLETIIKKCEDNGPYIVVAPGIAMPHARPEEGAIALGYALVTLKKPVPFGDPDNDPVELLIFMAAPSVKEHNEEAICQIADLCDDEDKIKELLNAMSISKMAGILRS
jgi:mannitol/fructose-specific phosphotransferase system IIA component (Ntr-type)